MGFKRWFSYNLLIGGTPANFLINPLMWGLFIYSFFGPVDHLTNPPILYYLSVWNLVVGNSLAVIVGMLGVIPRKKYYLLKYTLLIPFYWVLQSMASYKALWQLIIKPHYWEKTDHGISNFRDVSNQFESTLREYSSLETSQIRSNAREDNTNALVGIISAIAFFFMILLVFWAFGIF